MPDAGSLLLLDDDNVLKSVIPIPSDSEHRKLKSDYLSLLSPSEIIEICLKLDAHVPSDVQTSIWPGDLKSETARLKPDGRPLAVESNPAKTQPGDDQPLMDSLQRGPEATALIPFRTTAAIAATPDIRDETASASTQTESPPQPETSVPTATQPNPQPDAPQPTHLPTQPLAQLQYPYAFSRGAYPQGPYYAPPAGYPFIHPPVHHSSTHGSSSYHPYHPIPSTSSYIPPQAHRTAHPSVDDLPSYEEMIVEALTDVEDAEGCAPKDVFAWMASRYPLQTNFRPSASQALQKAYKRGRFEKSSSGKYRLNAAWEGGNSSRRTTRRPQTASGKALANVPPFTKLPLPETHGHHVPHSAGPPYPNPVYPYGYPPPIGYPGYPPHPSHPPTAPPLASAVNASGETPSSGSEAWEAAQSILKAISFDGLTQMSEDDDGMNDYLGLSSSHPKQTSTTTEVADHAQSANSHSKEVLTGEPSNVPSSLSAENQAVLRAHLSTLAAQLEELAREESREAEAEAAVTVPDASDDGSSMEAV